MPETSTKVLEHQKAQPWLFTGFTGETMNIVAVTACPTGIAHTYMAAEKLSHAAKKLGIELKVETQGAMGIDHKLMNRDIQSADWVLIVSDIEIEEPERFTSVRCQRVPMNSVLVDAESVLANYQN